MERVSLRTHFCEMFDLGYPIAAFAHRAAHTTKAYLEGCLWNRIFGIITSGADRELTFTITRAEPMPETRSSRSC